MKILSDFWTAYQSHSDGWQAKSARSGWEGQPITSWQANHHTRQTFESAQRDSKRAWQNSKWATSDNS